MKQQPAPNDFHCRECGIEIDLCAPDGSRLWCEEHCPDHEYKTDSMRNGRWCIHCDKPEPWD